MTENNDKLLIDFFAENRLEIPDNGFTRRVMRHLPDRTRRISQVWVTFCFTLALVLFFVFDGLQQVLVHFVKHSPPLPKAESPNLIPNLYWLQA